MLAIFAPSVETALSGAGWQANGSESVSARSLIEQNFAGLSSSAPMVVLHSPGFTAESPAFRAVVDRVETIFVPIAAFSPSRRLGAAPPSRPTVIRHRRRRRARRSDGDGGRRRRPEAEVAPRSRPLTFGEPDRRLGMWSDFNEGELLAMRKPSSTLAGDARDPHPPSVARRRRTAADADDPRLAGLGRTAGAAQQRFKISIWAMNFALMFALALGIDYALFVVHRFAAPSSARNSGARRGSGHVDTTGKAVLFSGAVLISSPR